MRLATLVFGLIACLACVTPASAVAVGDRLSRLLELDGKQVPLAGGEWMVAGLVTQPFSMPALGAFGAIRNAVLFLVRQNRVVAVLEVNSNALPVNDGWGRTKACAEDSKQFLLIQRYRTGWETSCLFVQTTRSDDAGAGPAAWVRARDFANRAGLSMPRLWLTAGFRVSDLQDLVDARYHFDPSLLLGSGAASLDAIGDWSAEAVNGDPLRLGAVQVVASWAAGFAACVERGLRNQLAVAPGSLPEAAAISSNSPAVDGKLRELDRLYRDGRITWDAYARQSQQATTEAPVYLRRTSLLTNAMEKNISFRSFGTFVDFGIAYLVTASSAISWGIALTLNATDSVWFVLNDQYWDAHYAAMNTHDSERIVDFRYIGEGPAS